MAAARAQFPEARLVEHEGRQYDAVVAVTAVIGLSRELPGFVVSNARVFDFRSTVPGLRGRPDQSSECPARLTIITCTAARGG